MILVMIYLGKMGIGESYYPPLMVEKSKLLFIYGFKTQKNYGDRSA